MKMKMEKKKGKYHLVSTNFVQSTYRCNRSNFRIEILNLEKKLGNKWC